MKYNRGALIERISFSTTGTLELKSAVSGETVYIHAIVVIPSEDGVTVTFTSNGEDISPAIPLIKAGNGFVLPHNEYAWFAGSESGDLSITVTGATVGFVILTQE